MRRHPVALALVPFAIFAILCGLGIFGAVAGANSVGSNSKSAALQLASDTSNTFMLSVQKARLRMPGAPRLPKL